MSRLTIGMVAAGALLASAAAVSVVAGAGFGDDNASRDIILNAGASTAPSGSAVVGAANGAATTPAEVGTARSAAAPQKVSALPKPIGAGAVKVVKPIRSVRLLLPEASSIVGANVTGTIVALDTAGKAVTPVSGVQVALQQLRGTAYATVADGVTDESGLLAVSFTGKVNAKWRAQLTLDTGKKIFSPVVLNKVSAKVTWAARPTMDLAPGIVASYAFRVVGSESTVGTTGHLEIANSKTPTKWVALKGVRVPAAGVVTQDAKFPTAGTWLLRGASGASPTNAPGYTTTLTIAVS